MLGEEYNFRFCGTKLIVGRELWPRLPLLFCWARSFLVDVGMSCKRLVVFPCFSVNSDEFTTVSVLEDIVFLPVVKIEEWQAMTFSWCSPLGARLRSKRWIPGVCALIRPTCEPAPLLQVAARRGFYNSPKQGLLQIGRHVDAPLVRTDLLPKVLLDLCTRVLGPLSDEIQLEILRHRIARRDDATDFLQTEEAKEMLEKDAADDGETFSAMKERER